VYCHILAFIQLFLHSRLIKLIWYTISQKFLLFTSAYSFYYKLLMYLLRFFLIKVFLNNLNIFFQMHVIVNQIKR